MGQYKAVFLDRDGTISKTSTVMRNKRNQHIGQLIGNETFEITNELNSKIFQQVSDNYIHMDDVTTLAIEEKFWRKWYQYILEEHGLTLNAEAISKDLYARFPFHDMSELYPETLELLRYLKANGYRLGVISDTFPSLELSLRSMGIADYFETFVASSIVGVMKPEPKIYLTALEALGVSADESIFVDDYDVEADGARNLGFTAFHIDRQQTTRNMETWTIGNLMHVAEYLEEVHNFRG